ncbi:MAG: penicillin-binding protein 2, partial [Thiohalocapsa sp.]|nr:penicillin-binding protein 2 [Thiohalocapsa sp.]
MDLLNALFQSAPWPTLRAGLHVAFMLAALYLLKQVFSLRAATALRHLAKPRSGFGVAFAGLVLLFAAMLAYQATWQLSGTSRPDFVAFMQLHDRRQFNPAHWIERGRLFDHTGELLAESRDFARGGETAVRRHYPYGPVFAHAVGYAHPRYGTAGMEAAANVSLNGGRPDSLAEWGELGRRLITRDKRPRGRDLTLTLDAALQQAAYRALGERAGAVVMLRPDDGAIRVLASTPAFDPNRLQAELFSGRDPRSRLLNRATHGLYPPGSVFKVVLAAQALDAGFSSRLDCPADGYTTSPRYRKIRDHEYYSARGAGRDWQGHGRIGLDRALIKSSNVFFAKLGVGYGHDAFGRTADRFLFNRTIALTASLSKAQVMRTGRIPRIAASDRYGLAQAAIGQGAVLATPAQMALIAAAVANGGVAPQPRLLVAEPPRPLARLMNADTASRLASMMRRVVSEGTGRV